MPVYSADFIYTLAHPTPLDNWAIETDANGKIIQSATLDVFKNKGQDIIYVEGILVPGFVNAHCHLELSHMKGLIPTGTSLIEFIKNIVTRRNDTAMPDILTAIDQAEQEMIQAGIVAVGDISNVTDTFSQKDKDRLLYHTFVEAFDLLQTDRAEAEMTKSKAVLDQLNCPPLHKKALVPHAPYSVSGALFKLLHQMDPHTSVSIHHQETMAENQFLFNKTGALVEFYTNLNIPLQGYQPIGAMASRQVINHMNDQRKTLLVHNTMSSIQDIQAIHAWNKSVYWVTCPNANLYIENRLPFYKYFIDQNAKLCIGTDSLASNWQLSILEEIKTIQKYQSYVSWDQLIQWASLNGAKALGFDDRLGSLEEGKTPGILNIFPFDGVNKKLLADSRVRRLV